MENKQNSRKSEIRTIILGLISGFCFLLSICSSNSFAADKTLKFSVSSVEKNSSEKLDSVTENKDAKLSGDNVTVSNEPRESVLGKTKFLDNTHFTWGADIGASLDLTAHDMSTFDLDVILGYKSKLFNIAGIGAGIHRTVQGGDNFVPVYALLRTSFTSRPSLFFLNVRVGYSFNTVENSPMFGDYNSSLGCGINLSQSHRAKTYLILGIGYRHFSRRHQDYISRLDTPYIWMTQLQFGVNF